MENEKINFFAPEHFSFFFFLPADLAKSLNQHSQLTNTNTNEERREI
jgi:hypothetical protein